MAIGAEILTVLRAEAGQFNATVREAQGTTSGFAGATKTLETVGKAAIAASVIGVKAALEHEQAHARLTTAIANSGSTWDIQASHVEALEGHMRRLGFTDSETETSLANLTNATHNVRQSMDLMGLAANIARGRHLDLEAASQLLVKVETGHVSLLGRIGIQTKDATGATISQEEAIKRLSALYGGQASAYSETFRGKLAALEAQFQHVAVAIGDFLIPKLTALFGFISDGISFFQRNAVAATALAVAIGGPLVTAMAYFVSLRVISFIETIVNGMIGLLNVIPGVTISTVALTSAHQAAAVAAAEQAAAEAAVVAAAEAQEGAIVAQATSLELLNAFIAQNEAAVTTDAIAVDAFSASEYDAAAGAATLALSVESVTAAEEAAAAAAALTAIAVAAIATVGIAAAVLGIAYAFGVFDTEASAAYIAGEKFADAQVKAFGTTEKLVPQYRDVNRLYHESGTALDRLYTSYNKTQAEIERFPSTAKGTLASLAQQSDSIQRLEGEHNKYGAALRALKPEYEKQVADQKKAVAETTVLAASLGVQIPYAASLGSAALKSLQKGINESTAIFGVGATQMAIDAHLTGEQLVEASNEAKKFAKTIEDSIHEATDPFKHFASATSVAEGDMEKFFVGSQLQAASWADEITGLIRRGVDIGIINEMAKAGPGSKPALDAFVAMVDAHGVDWVNSVEAAGRDAAKYTENAYNDMAITAAVKSAEIAQVGKAAFEDLQSGGTSNLQALAGSTDKNMAAMAYATALKIGEMEASIHSLPTDTPPIAVHVNIDDALANIRALETYLNAVDGRTVTAYAAVVPTGPNGPQQLL